MKMLLKKVDEFLFCQIDSRPADLCRIVTGLTLLLSTLIKWDFWEFYYSATGWIFLETNNNPQLNKPYGLLYYTDGIVSIWVYYILLLIASFCFMIGLRTKTAAITCLIILQSLTLRNPYSIMSCDMVLRIVIFFSCFGGFANTYSIDNKLEQINKKYTMAWPIRMVQLSIVLIYFFSIFGKVWEGQGWLDGSVLYWFLVNPLNDISYVAHLPLLLNPKFIALLTLLTIATQIQFLLLIWTKRFGPISLALVLAFHYYLLVACPSLRLFSLSMIGALLVFTPTNILDKLFISNDKKNH